MKAGWKTVKLGEACKIVNGATPSTSVEANWGGPHCWITPAEMGGLSDPYVSKTRRTLTDAGLADCSASLLPTGSVILSSRAPIGHVIINTVPMATNQGCKSMIPRSDLDAKFLFYFIKANVPLLESLGTGATFKELSGGKLASVEIPLPPLAEQKRIVALLDEAFAGIEEAKAKAEEGLSLSKKLFESSLNGMFEVKEGAWVDTQLTDVLEKQPQNGWSPPADNHSSEGTPALTLSSVTGFAFRPDKVKYTSAKVDRSKNYWVENGDLLITRSNTPELVGHVAIAESITTPTIYPDLIMRMTPKSGHATTEFLYYQLRTSKLRNEITGRAQGANPTMKKISNSAVKTLPVSIPSVKIQIQMSAKLKEAEQASDKLRSMYLEKIGALLELKSSLLAKAFAGELAA